MKFTALVLLMAPLALAERFSLPLPADAATNALFNPLQPKNALHAIVKKLFGNRTDVFSGNCSILFGNTVESAACDINPATPQNFGKKELPREYWGQILSSNILLATIYADWSTHTHKQSYNTDVFKKLSPCTASISESLVLSDSVERSESVSNSAEDSGTASLTEDMSKSSSHSADYSNSWSQSVSESFSNALSATRSWVASLTESLSRTQNPSSSETGTDSRTVTKSRSQSHTESATNTYSHTPTESRTASVSPVPSLSSQSSTLSNSHSETKSRTRQIYGGSEWALWSYSTGVYQDATNQVSRFSTSSGVVTDSYTSLQWEQATSAGTHTWSPTSAPGSAQDYCANQTTGGFDDWRIPTRIEQQTIMDYTLSSPSVNAAFSSVVGNYWSATSYATSPTSSWYSYSSTGGSSFIGNSGPYYVRCVRGGSAPVSVRYLDENGATLTGGSTQVKDAATGLIWQRVVSGTYTYTSAISYCAGLPLGGQTWRLPSVKELATLVDVSISGTPTINATAFPGAPNNYSWSSSVLASDSAQAWNVYENGEVTPNAKTGFYTARCVR